VSYVSTGAPAPRTLGEAVAWGATRLRDAGSETARLDAEVLLADSLRVDRSTLAAHPEALLGATQAEAYVAAVERRAGGEPVAYIRGLKEFHGAAIVVDRRVLIPRPETETLVDLAVERVRSELTSAPRPDGSRPYLVWDVGTGSGAIAVAVALELRRRRYADAVAYWLSDVSDEAIAVATVNVVSHGLADLVTFAQGDLDDVRPAPPAVDLVVANLPYIPSGDIPGLPVAASFEPRLALDGGADGLDLVRRLLPRLPLLLAPHGAALLEIGSDQAELIGEAVSFLLPGWHSHLHADLSGRPRVIAVERPDG
jgi:release factor glutamine methyltransferase